MKMMRKVGVDRLKLKLIAPSQGGASVGGFAPMLNLGMLAALTPSDVDITITDENVEPVVFDKDVDLVGITVLTPTAPRAYEIADNFRQMGGTVVLGGVHPTFVPEEASLHADAVCLGEAEGYWGQLIQDFKKGKLKKFYKCEEKPDPLVIPIARRDLFQKKGYIIRKTLLTTRGCPFSCNFCSVVQFFGSTYRFRAIEDIVNEVATLRGRGPIA